MTTVDATNAAAVAQAVKNGKPAECSPATVRRSASIANIAAAMCKAQASIDDPTKNKKADAGPKQYRYADLPTVLEVVRPALSANNLAVMQFPCEYEGQAAVTTLLAHTSGEWIEAVAMLRPVKTDPQGIGSALTYMKRYSLLSLCGIAADDDDDGAAASRPPQHRQQEPRDDLELRRAAEKALRDCKDRPAYLAVCKQLNEDVAAGKFSQADRDYLSGVSKEINARHPAVKTGGAA